MEIILKPKGRGSSHFVAFLGKKSFRTDSINGFNSESVCKSILFDAVLKRADAWLDNGKRIDLIIDSIEMTNKDNAAALTGFTEYKIGYGGRTVKFVGLVKF
jgi:hypothetical protein